MGLELAQAFIRVSGDASGLKKDFQGAERSSIASIKRLALKIAGAFAVIGVGALGIRQVFRRISEGIALAERQIQAEQRVAAVVRSTGQAAGFTAKELIKQASALQAVTTVGDEKILELQATMLSFRKVTGDVFEQAIELSLDLAAVMGTDAKSSALQLGKALEDPIRGVTALGRAGVTFTQVQRDQIKVLSETNQLYAAQVLIIQEVQSQVAGVARELAKTDAGRLAQARNILGDVKEELGTAFIPIATALTKLQIGLARAFTIVGKEAAIVIKRVIEIITSIRKLESVQKALSRGAVRFRQAWELVKRTVVSTVQALLKVFLKVFNKISGLNVAIKDLPGLIGEAFALMVDIISRFVLASARLFEILVTNWDGIWGTIKDVFITSFLIISDVAKDFWDNFTEISKAAFATLKDAVTELAKFMGRRFVRMVKLLGVLALTAAKLFAAVIAGKGGEAIDDIVEKALIRMRTLAEAQQADFLNTSVGLLSRAIGRFAKLDLFKISEDTLKRISNLLPPLTRLFAKLFGPVAGKGGVKEVRLIPGPGEGIPELFKAPGLAGGGEGIEERQKAQLGRLAFPELSRSLQDALLQQDNPVLEVNKEILGEMKGVNKNLEKFLDLPARGPFEARLGAPG